MFEVCEGQSLDPYIVKLTARRSQTILDESAKPHPRTVTILPSNFKAVLVSCAVTLRKINSTPTKFQLVH